MKPRLGEVKPFVQDHTAGKFRRSTSCQTSFIHSLTQQILVYAPTMCEALYWASEANQCAVFVPSCETKRAQGRPLGNTGSFCKGETISSTLPCLPAVPVPLATLTPGPGRVSIPHSPLSQPHLHCHYLQDGLWHGVLHFFSCTCPLLTSEVGQVRPPSWGLSFPTCEMGVRNTCLSPQDCSVRNKGDHRWESPCNCRGPDSQTSWHRCLFSNGEPFAYLPVHFTGSVCTRPLLRVHSCPRSCGERQQDPSVSEAHSSPGC